MYICIGNHMIASTIKDLHYEWYLKRSVKTVFQCCVFFTYVYVRVLNTRQWTSLRVLSTYTYEYVYVRKKKRITGKQP